MILLVDNDYYLENQLCQFIKSKPLNASYHPCVMLIRCESSLLNLLHLEVKTEAGI